MKPLDWFLLIDAFFAFLAPMVYKNENARAIAGLNFTISLGLLLWRLYG